ncbi:hypothetical protein AAHB37_19015 [Glutamicibacter halophytocola]|uniref:hypothetical protein n=1 Tax=Glutamicibacter halophytocola TaxID=1933880 RepID=UPI00321962B3
MQMWPAPPASRWPWLQSSLREAEGASEQSRERVKQAARDLGYRPDSRARSLRGHRNRTIGVALMLGQPPHAELADALYAAADSAGYEIILGATGASRDERRVLDTLADSGVEAIIAIASRLDASATGYRGRAGSPGQPRRATSRACRQ